MADRKDKLKRMPATNFDHIVDEAMLECEELKLVPKDQRHIVALHAMEHTPAEIEAMTGLGARRIKSVIDRYGSIIGTVSASAKLNAAVHNTIRFINMAAVALRDPERIANTPLDRLSNAQFKQLQALQMYQDLVEKQHELAKRNQGSINWDALGEIKQGNSGAADEGSGDKEDDPGDGEAVEGREGTDDEQKESGDIFDSLPSSGGTE